MEMSITTPLNVVADHSAGEFALDEPSDYPDRSVEGYAAIQREFVQLLARAQGLALRIATAIANEFGAHG